MKSSVQFKQQSFIEKLLFIHETHIHQVSIHYKISCTVLDVGDIEMITST